MAKNIYMVDPFEVLTGNLGSKQDLRYREHDNKAYEAPDGIARAKNYRTRYVGVRRADGSVYFMVKKKSTANLNNKSRMTMAILGSISAIKSVLKASHFTDWRNLNSIYNYRMAHGGDEAGSSISFNKWLDFWLRQMLLYKQTTLTLTASGLSVVINNPYAAYDNANALVIADRIFKKFVAALSTAAGVQLTIDGMPLFAPEIAWKLLIGADNMNYRHMFSDFTTTAADEAPVLYKGQQVYGDEEAINNADIVDGIPYTTIAPSA